MRRWLVGLMAAVVMLATPAVHAREAAPLADDQAVEDRLVGIAEDLRCLVCQNESLAGSRAALAEDLRREIREQIRAGKTDPEIVDYLVGRYGDFVRYKPPLKSTTWLLWLGPFVLVAVGLATLVVQLKRRNVAPAGPLSDDERSRAVALMGGER